ncbi:MAG: hypothetical protein AAGB19_16230 [Cyanobacteria bacterium P01_F01_bin.3]
MKFNLKKFSLVGLAAATLLASPVLVNQSAHAEGGRRGEVLEQLDLTDAQASEIESIREDAKAQMRTVLTPEQQATLENSEVRGRRAFRQLDLSESQREQLQAIRESSREEVSEVLTSEQLEQLEELREEYEGRRGERRSGVER